jgi:hypothetical protein
MKESICVEAGRCCTHSLNQTFRSVIRHERLRMSGPLSLRRSALQWP